MDQLRALPAVAPHALFADRIMTRVARGPEAEHLTADDLELWVEGALPLRGETHLRHCRECQALADAERVLVMRLEALPLFHPAPVFADRVMARVEVPVTSIAGAWRRWRSRAMAEPTSVGLAAGVAVMLGGSIAASAAWAAGNQEFITGAGRALLTNGETWFWQGVTLLNATIQAQSWYTPLRAGLTPGRIVAVVGLGVALYAAGIVALKRLIALPGSEPARALQYRLPILRAALALLLGLAAPLEADPGEHPAVAWKSRFELLSQMLSNDPSQVILDHVVSVASGSATIAFDYSGGGALTLALDGGEVRIDGRMVGSYPVGGALEAAWRQLALDVSRSSTPDALTLIRNWSPDGLSREELSFVRLLQDKVAPLSAPPSSETTPQALPPAEAGGLTIDLRDLSNPNHLAPLLRASAGLRGAALRVTVPGGQARVGHYSVGSSERIDGHLLIIRGDADIYGTVIGNIASVDGDIIVHPGGVVTGDALAVAGQVRDVGGEIRGQIRTLDRPHSRLDGPSRRVEAPLSPLARLARNGAGVAGVFLTLLMVGFGLVLFARPPLEVVSDTVLHSFSRALMVGLLGQVLVLPTFGMLVVGLVLSVAGILLVPFAVIVFGLLLIIAILVGSSRSPMPWERPSPGGSWPWAPRSPTPTATATSRWGWAAWRCSGSGGCSSGWVPVAGTLIMLTATLVTCSGHGGLRRRPAFPRRLQGALCRPTDPGGIADRRVSLGDAAVRGHRRQASLPGSDPSAAVARRLEGRGEDRGCAAGRVMTDRLAAPPYPSRARILPPHPVPAGAPPTHPAPPPPPCHRSLHRPVAPRTRHRQRWCAPGQSAATRPPARRRGERIRSSGW